MLAVPAPVAARLVPGLIVPDDYAPIVNAHFRCAPPAGAAPFAGIVGGTAEWVFRKPGVVSVTVSAADRLVDRAAGELIELLWRDVAKLHDFPAFAGAAGANCQGAAGDIPRHARSGAAPAWECDTLGKSSRCG